MADERKVAIITGASRGIGAALVDALVARNYRVVAVAREMKAADRPDALVFSGDVGDPALARDVVGKTIAACGRIDLLVNNAGTSIAKPFTAYAQEDFDRLVTTNVAGFFHMTQAAVAAMEPRGSGHVVSVTTTMAELGNSKVAAALTALTKGGINAASKNLAIEYARRGIRFNVVSPGIIKTGMHAPETHEAKAAMHPMGRMGEIDDVVGAILYVEDAPFVTGEILHVDGGQSAGR